MRISHYLKASNNTSFLGSYIRTLWLYFFMFFLSGCYIIRTIKWGIPKVEDRDKLPHQSIALSSSPKHFNISIDTTNNRWVKFLDTILPISNTVAFLIIKNDTLQYEYYGNNFSSEMQFNGFSLSKSFIGALYGIAIRDGIISSTNIPFTYYLPEFLLKDSAFGKITLQHLLDMRSGIKLHFRNVKMVAMKNYYGRNITQSLKNIYIARPPGTFEYENANSQLLALILVKVTGKPIELYL